MVGTPARFLRYINQLDFKRVDAMKGRPALLAALTLAPLLLAGPALAQAQPGPDELPRSRIAGPSYAEAHGPRNDFVGQDGALFPEGRSRGVGVSAQPLIRDDGSRATRTGVVGSLPVAPNTSLDLGLFRVNRISQRERDLNRLQPMRDVNERGSTMAAVGLKVRFR
jgi:hypothetical protein